MDEVVFFDPFKAHMQSGHVRDFSEYRESLGDSFCKSVVKAYKALISDLRVRSDQTYYLHSKSFLNFLSKDQSTGYLRELLIDGVFPDKSTMYQLYSNAATDYRFRLQQNIEWSNKYRNALANTASRLIRCLAAQGAWYHGIAVPGFKVVSTIGHSLLTTKVLANVSQDDVCDLIEEHRSSWSVVEENFFENLLLKNDVKDLSSDRLVVHSIVMLQERIELLRNYFAEIIISRQRCLDDADAWASDEKVVERAKYLHRLITVGGGMGARKKGAEYRRCLEMDPLKTFVVFCRLFCSGIFPRFVDKQTYLAVTTKMRERQISRKTIEAHLVADLTALSASFGYLMLKFSGNGEAIRDLRIDCISDVPGSSDIRISWQKHRKGSHPDEYVFSTPRPASEELTPDSITPHCVITYVLAATEKLRKLADEEQSKFLFLNFHKNLNKIHPSSNERIYAPSVPASETFNNHFQALCELASGGDWNASPKALRTSNLILTALVERDAFAVQEQARHSSLHMGSHYVNSFSTTLLRDKKVREFLDWFETVTTVDIEDFASKVGIDKEAYDRRKKLINQQFGGLHCSDPLSGIQPGTRKGEVCTAVENCPTCDNRRNIFLVSPENFANVMMFHEALEALQANSPEQFEKWKLWFSFTSYVLDRIVTKPQNRRDYERALLIKDQVSDNAYNKVFARSSA